MLTQAALLLLVVVVVVVAVVVAILRGVPLGLPVVHMAVVVVPMAKLILAVREAAALFVLFGLVDQALQGRSHQLTRGIYK
jgi:hypothetical protein